MSVPTTTAEYRVEGKANDFSNMKYNSSAQIPKLGDHDCLVKIEAVSLNYRDLIIPKGMYPFPMKPNVVPCSDGAGTIVSVGPRVTRFKPGDSVCTLFNQAHMGGPMTPSIIGTGVGGAVDGTLRQYAAYEESGLVAKPKNLSAIEASTLPCAALTAWNALYGLEGKQLKPGDTVLTQGTGGVSIFALQFAVAAGARVIATTSSEEKGKKLKELGAHAVINYRTDEKWGETAKKLSGDGEGVHHVIEVGGNTTMPQSLQAVRMDGLISIVGFLGGGPKDGSAPPTMVDALMHLCTVRGLLVGNRQQFEEMNAAITANGVKPVVDEKVFPFEKAKDAFQYQWEQKHFGKLCIEVK
ncbi:MAG: hypothetical protein Q9227_005807 [Pyrenula ochraceoflavens]